MITNFNEQLAIDFDVDCAIFIENLLYWIKLNAAKDKLEQRNFNDNRYWSYNSYPELAKLFPCWSAKSIRTIIARCIKHELIIIDCFNKKKYDNTNWYTLSDKALEFYPHAAQKLYPPSLVEVNIGDEELHTPAQTGRPPAQTGRPIPKELNSLRENTTTSSSKPKGNELLRELIEIYRQEFPNNPQPHKTLISTSLEKILRTLIKRWPEADPEKRPLTADGFRKYLIYLRDSAPKFALCEYETKSGAMKKNGLDTFARWNTFVKCLEGAYS